MMLRGREWPQLDQASGAKQLQRHGVQSGHICLSETELCDNQKAPNQVLWEKKTQEAVMQSPIYLLCQSLKNPSCVLKTLRFWGCSLTDACCGDLAAVFCTSQTLLELELDANGLGDAGVHVLCEGLKHPACQLKAFRLSKYGFSEETLRELAHLRKMKPSLNIGYIF
ncbi:NACHT, LRR and PYD domains-containing protein 1-like [Dromaius novaehollandiae]|uniref:NACHT, LRR and PYD domains-containing protein 1-like n=1 Tax=Dromaius novaehollandiae TaxID=8790 RepID=UPI00311EDDFB